MFSRDYLTAMRTGQFVVPPINGMVLIERKFLKGKNKNLQSRVPARLGAVNIPEGGNIEARPRRVNNKDKLLISTL
jgi:hypothetical protein